MTDKIDALVAQLDDYLQGCPDPNKVWPKWMVRKASRLLWACREALAEQPAEAVGTVLGGEFHYLRVNHGLPDGTKLYTTPPAASLEEIMAVLQRHRVPGKSYLYTVDANELARALLDSAGGAKGEWRCACGDVNAANETCGLCHQSAPQPDGD